MGIFGFGKDKSLVAMAEGYATRKKALEADSNLKEAARSYLTASTTAERLVKSLHSLEKVAAGNVKSGDVRLTTRDAEQYESQLRSDIAQEEWQVRTSAIGCSKIGTTDPILLHRYAASIAPKSEREAIAAYKKPEFRPNEVTLESARDARIGGEQKSIAGNAREVIARALGRDAVRGVSPQGISQDIRRLVMASDTLVRKLETELLDRGIVVSNELMPGPASVRKGPKEPPDQDTILKLGGLSLLTGISSGFVGLAGITHSGLDGTAAQVATIAGSTISVTGLAAAVASLPVSNHMMLEGAEFQAMKAGLELRESAVAEHCEMTFVEDAEKLTDIPTSKIYSALDIVRGLRTDAAKLVLSTSAEPDIPQAFGEASDVLWKSYSKGVEGPDLSVAREGRSL